MPYNHQRVLLNKTFPSFCSYLFVTIIFNHFHFEQAFIDEMSDKADVSSSLIGQFGVGFYSTFMVGDNVEVFTQSCKAGSAPLKWTSAGLVVTLYF